jgi:hypothetical protein
MKTFYIVILAGLKLRSLTVTTKDELRIEDEGKAVDAPGHRHLQA